MPFERMGQKLLARRAYARRLMRSIGFSTTLIALSLLLGTGGYRVLGGLGWVDAFENASMILTGMGPVDRMTTSAGKLFASFYALFSGVAFLTAISVVVAPVLHRFLHRFHLEEDSRK